MMALPNDSAIASLPAIMPSSTYFVYIHTGPVLTLTPNLFSVLRCPYCLLTALIVCLGSGASGFATCPGGVVSVA